MAEAVFSDLTSTV